MAKLGRGNSAASKLTPTEVRTIRERYAQGWTQGSLCREFGVSIVQIGRIVRGEVWQKLPTGPGQLSEGEIKAAEERLLAMHSGDKIATMAAEFEAMLKEQGSSAPTRRIPNPLEGDDVAGEAAGEGLTKLQQQAAAMGVDIDKLRGEVK